MNALTTRLPLKPLSANALYRNVSGVGRVKTKAYKTFYRDMMLLLPAAELSWDYHHIEIVAGVSNVQQDLDNTLKPILDCLQAKYSFNDSKVYYIKAEKKLAPKQQEFIEITIKPYWRKQ